MSDTQTAIDEIRLRIKVLESQIEHEWEEINLAEHKKLVATEKVAQLAHLRDQWHDVLTTVRASLDAEAGR